MEHLPPEQQALIESEIQRQLSNSSSSLSSELAGVAGLGVGSVAGLGLVSPFEAFVQNQQLKKALAQTKLFDNERDAFQALRGIFEGKQRFEDFGEAAEVLQELYANPQIKGIIQDEKAYRKVMKQYQYGRVLDLASGDSPHAKSIRMNKMKQYLPFRNAVSNFSKQVTHPLVSVGAIGGTLGGHALYNYLQQKGDGQMKTAEEQLFENLKATAEGSIIEEAALIGKAKTEAEGVTGRRTIGNEEAGVAKTAQELFYDLMKTAEKNDKKENNNVSVGAAAALSGLATGGMTAVNAGKKIKDHMQTNEFQERLKQEGLTDSKKFRRGVMLGGAGAAGLVGTVPGLIGGSFGAHWHNKLMEKKEKKKNGADTMKTAQELFYDLTKTANKTGTVKNFLNKVTGKDYKNSAKNFHNAPDSEIAAAKMNLAKEKRDKARLATGASVGALGLTGVGAAALANRNNEKEKTAQELFYDLTKTAAKFKPVTNFFRNVSGKNKQHATANLEAATGAKDVYKATQSLDRATANTSKARKQLGAGVGALGVAGVGGAALVNKNKEEEKTASNTMTGLYKEAAQIILETPFPEVKQLIDPMNKIAFPQ